MTRATRTFALIAAAGMCTPALAQYSNQQQDRQRQSDQDRRSQQSRSMQQDRQSPRSGATLDWESTTVIGYDLNGDGRADTYYAANTYEIEKMRDQWTRQRQQMTDADRREFERQRRQAWEQHRREMQRGDRMRQGDQMRQGDRQRMIRTQAAEMADQPKTVRGTIRGLKDFNLTGVKDARTVARVETDDGERIAVILGSADQVDRMDLSQGEQVMLSVRPGSIDNRRVFVADRLKVGDKTYRVQQSEIENLKRITGEIVDTKTVELNRRGEQRSQQHLLVKVRNDNGNEQVISLGPVSARDRSDLKQGEKICALASPSRVNGQQVYMARKFSHDGETTSLSAYNERRQDRDRQRDQRDRRDQREGM